MKDEWFSAIQSRYALPAEATQQLRELGFTVVTRLAAPDQLPQLVAA